LELGWLAAAIIVPLFFNVYTSRVFEPDKISVLRSLVIFMTVAWLVKLLEGGWRAVREDDGRSTLSSAVQGAAQAGLPSWLGFLRVPMIVPILVYALAYLISSLFTITPDPTWFGSYQRLQGTYSQYSYMMLGILVIANLRSRPQLERLVNFMILTSIPVTLYGFLQWAQLDPLPWAGDTSTRVASTMGNAIFVAAWLIMIVPLILYRLFTSLATASPAEQPAPTIEPGRRTRIQNPKPKIQNEFGWAVVANVFGVLLIQALMFFLALKVMAGLPYPDARMWWVLPLALLTFYLSCLAIEWLGKHGDDPAAANLIIGGVGVTLLLVGFLAVPFTWSLDRGGDGGIQMSVGFDGFALPWLFFFFFLWLAVSAGARVLQEILPTNADEERELLPTVPLVVYGVAIIVQALCLLWTGASILWTLFYVLLWGVISSGIFALLGSKLISATHDTGTRVMRWGLNAGYSTLLLLQLWCIYLTQSRGPWIGLGVALVTFAVSLWLVGRRRNVRWMARLGGSVSAVVLVFALFVVALNIPGSPLKSLSSLPGLGRGIERLSTLTRTEDGTGKVRELIWEGATNLILSDPVRSIIGWGPEAMYVAYSRFYPAELAHWELRNATPDRSHNVEFDQLVTMGLLGLMTYYFLVGAFFYYGLRTLKRATNTRDQLLVIALLSAMAAHFMEIQTGIQIAATWSYFYMLIGMMVAFGFYINGNLRPEYAGAQTVAPHQAAQQDGAADDHQSDGADALTPGSTRSAIPATATSSYAAGATQSRAPATSVRTGGNSKGKNLPPSPPPVGRGRANQGPTQGRTAGQAADARRRQAQMQARSSRDGAGAAWFRNPIFVAVYAVAAIAALLLAWSVNVSTVRADIRYKQALAYDNAQLWHESINYYSDAIAVQPNQDYYYLFLGRAWLEFAKQVDQERPRTALIQRMEQGNPGWPGDGNWRVLLRVPLNVSCAASPQTYKSDSDRQQERLCRLRQSENVLSRARDLNPRNTDHYANLGRLYLYWADATGAGDTSKTKFAVQNFERATQSTPGNAQLWDELAVAYARDNQFNRALETLNHSQTNVDARYARTPFLRGQLYQERALNVKERLAAKAPLPSDGETDYGKLVLEAGRAYSDTIGLDPAQFLDANYTIRVEFLLDAANPFTATNTTLPRDVASNVLTSTVKLALEQQVPEREKQVADFLRTRGAYQGQESAVPNNLLESLRQNPAWARLPTGSTTPEWADSTFATITHNAALIHSALGYTYGRIGDTARSTEHYQRALALEPNNQDAQKALQPPSP
jgi:tetratricopeptide (TPR) repeat protein